MTIWGYNDLGQRGKQKQDIARSDIIPAKRRTGTVAVRREKNRRINQQVLRESIAAGQHHRHIKETIEEVGKLVTEVKKKKTMCREEQAAFMSKLAALKTKADLQLKMLNKYLPDLRSIEFREGEEGNPFAAAARAWAEALAKDS